MEAFLEASPGMKLRRGAIAFAGVVDVTATAALLINYFLVGPTDWRSQIALGFNVFHAFTWAFAFVMSAHIVSVPLVTAGSFLYLVAGLLDLAAFFLHLAAARLFGGLFHWFVFVISAIFLGVALVVFLSGWKLSVLTKRYRLRMIKAVAVVFKNYQEADAVHAVFIWLERIRLFLSTLWWVQLATVLALGAVTLASSPVDLPSYTILLLFDVPHAFTWIFARAMAGTMPPPDKGKGPPDSVAEQRYASTFAVVFSAAALLSIVGTVLRLVVLIPETNSPTLTTPFLIFWRQVALWASFALSSLLLVIAVADAILTYVSRTYIAFHSKRISAVKVGKDLMIDKLRKNWKPRQIDDNRVGLGTPDLDDFEGTRRYFAPAPAPVGEPKKKFRSPVEKLKEQVERRTAAPSAPKAPPSRKKTGAPPVRKAPSPPASKAPPPPAPKARPEYSFIPFPRPKEEEEPVAKLPPAITQIPPGYQGLPVFPVVPAKEEEEEEKEGEAGLF